MTNYFDYLPCGPVELGLGFHVSGTGFTRAIPNAVYPSRRHPADHVFDWAHGRVLSAFQLVFISEGSGKVEWKGSPVRSIKAGQCFFVFPGIWHRYRPDPVRGWSEHWFELRGNLVDLWLKTGFLTAPMVATCSTQRMLAGFRHLHEVCRMKAPGYVPILAGSALAILGEAMAKGRRAATPTVSQGLIHRARLLIRAEPQLKVADIATRLKVGYPTLHRCFLRETGLSPKQYHEQLRFARAEELLAGTKLSVKEIAAHLGFYSAFHFSRRFKDLRHVAPTQWRKAVLPG